MKSPRGPRAVYASPLVIIPFLLLAKSSLAETFSIVVLPDTQFYTQDSPAIFDRQTDWIVHPDQASENIIYVAHLGDIVDSQFCNGGATEWGNASTSIATLDAAIPAIPYGMHPGNHDFDTVAGGPACATTRVNYNNNFGPSRYGAWYGGSQAGAGNNDNNFTLFSSAGGVEFIAINLAYSGSNGATEMATLAWADNLLKTNPNRIGIVTSHSILSDDRTGGVDCRSTDAHTEYGRLMWEELKDNPNLTVMLSGHCFGERWITYEGGGAQRPDCLGDVHVLLSNYQGYEGNESGYMRIMRFDTAARTLEVDTFTSEAGMPASTTVPFPDDDATMNQDSVSNFSLDYNAFVSQCVDVALAVDRSGSMNAASAVAGTKLDALQNAANLFIDQIALDGRHRLVIEQFNSASVPLVPTDVVPWTVLNSTNAILKRTQIGNIVGGGATNIIGGLEAAVDELDVISPNERRVVVLFTDGQHNTPPVANNAALQAALQNEINDVDTAMELYSVGFGTSINNGPLSGAAGANGGWHVSEVDPLIVGKNFSVVAAHVMGNQTLSDPVFLIKPGETKSHRFGVSRADTDLTIAVNWDRFDPGRIKTNVIPPAGASCSIASSSTVSGTQQTSGTNYRLIRVDLPFACSGADAHEGEWEVQMTASTEVRAPERVNILAFASTPIKLNARVDLVAGRLNIDAVLNGAPLNDANFTAYILPPLPETGDSTRLDSIGSDPAGAASIPPLALIARTPVAVALTVTGRSAESIEAEGTFDPRGKGLFQVRIVADLIDGSGQSVSREAMASFYNPKSKPFFPPIWISILVIFFVLLAGYVIFRRSKLG